MGYCNNDTITKPRSFLSRVYPRDGTLSPGLPPHHHQLMVWTVEGSTHTHAYSAQVKHCKKTCVPLGCQPRCASTTQAGLSRIAEGSLLLPACGVCLSHLRLAGFLRYFVQLINLNGPDDVGPHD